MEKEKIILVIFLIFILLAGTGIYFWQFINNKEMVEEINSEKIRAFNSQTDFKEKTHSSSKIKNKEKKQELVIHIDGEVENPGVYKLKENSRVIDALKLAGGETEIADLTKINLAKELKDGIKILIPKITRDQFNSKDEDGKVENKKNNFGFYTEKSEAGKININTCNKNDLINLSGIGEVKAQNIINYRKEQGKFEDLQQLTEINGIGEKTLENIKNELYLR